MTSCYGVTHHFRTMPRTTIIMSTIAGVTYPRPPPEASWLRKANWFFVIFMYTAIALIITYTFTLESMTLFSEVVLGAPLAQIFEFLEPFRIDKQIQGFSLFLEYYAIAMIFQDICIFATIFVGMVLMLLTVAMKFAWKARGRNPATEASSARASTPALPAPVTSAPALPTAASDVADKVTTSSTATNKPVLCKFRSFYYPLYFTLIINGAIINRDHANLSWIHATLAQLGSSIQRMVISMIPYVGITCSVILLCILIAFVKLVKKAREQRIMAAAAAEAKDAEKNAGFADEKEVLKAADTAEAPVVNVAVKVDGKDIVFVKKDDVLVTL